MMTASAGARVRARGKGTAREGGVTARGRARARQVRGAGSRAGRGAAGAGARRGALLRRRAAVAEVLAAGASVDGLVGSGGELASIAEGYSKSSYYTALGLFLFSLPGLWSLIKRSTKSKIVKKSYEIPGPAAAGAVGLDDTARRIAGYFRERNYEMQTAGQKVVFEGKYEPNTGQAAYITFCSFVGLGSFALVLSIVRPELGNYWYLMTLVSPAAGYYYWSKSGRVEKIEVKMVTSDDDATTEIIVLGDDEEVESFRKELDLMEKGKVYVKGLLEQ